MPVTLTPANVGAAPGDGSGDTARAGAIKLNANDAALAAGIAGVEASVASVGASQAGVVAAVDGLVANQTAAGTAIAALQTTQSGFVTDLAGKATAAQGAKADTAVQPGVLTGYATAAQGVRADAALPVSGTAASATKLATARNINGVPFDGSADVTLPGVGGSSTWGGITGSLTDQPDLSAALAGKATAAQGAKADAALPLSGTAVSATKLATARNINGTPFDGTADISISGGTPGAAATIAPGTVTKIAAGGTPTVQNTGTSSAAVFAFGLVTGDKGDKGDNGAGAPFTTNAQTGTSYTLLASDAGKQVTMNNASANTLNVADNTLVQNDPVVIRNIGTGATTVQQSGSMNLLGGGGTVTLNQYESCGILGADATHAYLEVSSSAPSAAGVTLTATLPNGTAGTAYSGGSVTGTNVGGATGAITFSATGLPAGLSIGTVTGSGPYTAPIIGTPTTAVSGATVSFTGTNGTQAGAATRTITIAAAAVPSITTTLTLPDGTVGAAYTGSISATNTGGATGAITFTATGLPAGLSIGTVVVSGSTYTAPVTGTPTTAAAGTVNVTASNGTQTATPSQSVTIAAAVTKPGVLHYSHIENTTTTTSFSLPISPTPAAGNLLLLAVVAKTSSGAITPTGYTAQGHQTPSGGSPENSVWTYSKISDGTETSVTVPFSVASGIKGCAAGLAECVNSVLGSQFGGFGSFTSSATTYTSGAFTAAPADPAAVPLCFFYAQNADTTIVPNGPWDTGFYYTAGVIDGSLGYMTQPAPNAAVNARLARTTSGASNPVAYITTWLEPV